MRKSEICANFYLTQKPMPSPFGEGGNAKALTDEVDKEESLCVVALSHHRHPAVPLPFQERLGLVRLI